MKTKIKDLLPVGSVVRLQNGTKYLVITGVKQRDLGTGETYDYIIYNINGQILQQGRNIAENNVIDVADLPNGFYFIKLMTNNKLVRNQKLIIQK